MLWLVGLLWLCFFTRLEYTYLQLLQSGQLCNDLAHQLGGVVLSLRNDQKSRPYNLAAAMSTTTEKLCCKTVYPGMRVAIDLDELHTHTQ